MTTNVKVFRSTDRAALALSGQAGTLAPILDACLVNGYNSQTVTITSANGTATVAANDHGFLAEQCVLISGANESEYNGEFYVLAASTNSFTYTVTETPASPATGTITAKMAPAGWSIAYTGTNLRDYKTLGGNQMYLDVVDTTAQYMTVRGYQAMSSLGVGTEPFPTVAQQAAALVWDKSNTADATVRPWVIVCNDKTMYFYVQGTSSTTNYNSLFTFGDFKSYKVGDVYSTILTGNIAGATRFSNPFTTVATAINTITAGYKYVCRFYTGIGGSVRTCLIGDQASSNNSNYLGGSGSGNLQYPNPADGGFYLFKPIIVEPNVFRGHHFGILSTPHNFPLALYDTFLGSGVYSGKKYMCVVDAAGASAGGQVYIEISNTWES